MHAELQEEDSLRIKQFAISKWLIYIVEDYDIKIKLTKAETVIIRRSSSNSEEGKPTVQAIQIQTYKR